MTGVTGVKTSKLPKKSPVVVIGGGIIGVSTLYHLARRGVEGAVLVERKQLASGTTWHAAGIVGQLRESSAQTELSKYTARLFGELEEETGQATGYKQNGTINLALSDVRLEQLLRSHDHARRMEIESSMLSSEQLASMWPWIRTDDVKGAFHVPSNGQVNPLDVTVALAKGAKNRGAQIFENTAVSDIVVRDGRINAVVTETGTILTDKVVLAGGMWSHHLAKSIGATVPLHAVEHFYIVTEPFSELSREQPILNIAEERLYWKEDAGKLLIGGFEAQGKAWAVDGIPEAFEFDELPFDMQHAEPELERMFERMPKLAELGVQTFFCGPESFTPDGRPHLGPSPEVAGLYIATGMNSNGILNSGGVGLTMAEWIVDGTPSRGMGPLMAARVHPFQKNTAYNAERAAESIGFHYGLNWPGRQVRSARGLRRVPLHDRLISAGAKMAERIGWEIPMYFDTGTADWPEVPSIGWQGWSESVRDECLAARDAAVLLDQSMYAKIIVQGPDAARALNRVCGADIDVENGTSVYSQFLNDRGGIEADVTITRAGSERFIVVTGHPSQIRDQLHVARHADPEWRFEIFDATSAYGLLSVHGPNSRAILRSLSGDDVGDTAFPFGAAREIDLAYARVLAIRRSFLGELGFELLISTEFTQHVYEALVEAGAQHGLRHAGMFAMNACRLEKGFRHFGHDIGEDDTPYEAGLGFAVDLSKKEAFVGRDALARQKISGTSTADRLALLAVDQATARDGPYLIHNEPVWRGQDIAGHVTSGGWGWRLEKMIGLVALHNSDGVSREWIDAGGFDVQIAGKRHPVTMQLQPFYDPKGERMRA